MPNYVLSQSPHRVVLRNYEGVICSYTEPEGYVSDCHCPDCESQRPHTGVAKVLNGEQLSIEPKDLERHKRSHHE
jgi:lysine 2,3-aminomutase